MIKIKEIKGFKYIGDAPSWVTGFDSSQNFRKNFTYMCLYFSNWEKDRCMLSFISEHVSSVDQLEEIIEQGLIEGLYDLKKDLHIIIRQDDDDQSLYGKEYVILSSIKPKGIDKYITKQNKFYDLIKKG